jgi:hypothetical protein
VTIEIIENAFDFWETVHERRVADYGAVKTVLICVGVHALTQDRTRINPIFDLEERVADTVWFSLQQRPRGCVKSPIFWRYTLVQHERSKCGCLEHAR